MNAATPPRWFKVVAGIAAAWMLFGVVMWFVDLLFSEAMVAGMSEGQRALFESRPQALFVVYGVAIFSGLAGALGLVLRKAWAVPALAVSLVAAVVQFAYTFFVMDAVGHIGAAALPFPILILAIGTGLLWLALRASRRGWLAGRSAAPAAARPVV
jgi:hypothetical protein